MRRGFLSPAAICGFRFLAIAAFFTSLHFVALGAPGESPKDDDLHPSSTMVKQELTTVIEGQLAAFRANDYTKAYTFASSEIRQQFELPQFETMVRTGFPVIDKSKEATFGLAFDTGEEAIITVRVENEEKQSVTYHYHLKKEGTGWRISGVTATAESNLVV